MKSFNEAEVRDEQIKITKNETKPKKVVSAYGETWHVPKWVKWIAIDDGGWIYAYKDMPVVGGDTWCSGMKSKHIGQADLNCADWRETLVKVGNEY